MPSDNRIIVDDKLTEMHTSIRDENDIIVNIRQMDISCTETPYLTVNIHFTGPCENKCKGCHSKALWDVKKEDKTSLHEVIKFLTDRHNSGLVHGICIMGTDNRLKDDAVIHLIGWARNKEYPSIVYTGFPLEKAMERYGYPDLYVCGVYHSGTWDQNKTFYKLSRTQDRSYYQEITIEEYFADNRRS